MYVSVCMSSYGIINSKWMDNLQVFLFYLKANLIGMFLNYVWKTSAQLSKQVRLGSFPSQWFQPYNVSGDFSDCPVFDFIQLEAKILYLSQNIH